jgi:DNA-binding CsgD family transcriptional regulator
VDRGSVAAFEVLHALDRLTVARYAVAVICVACGLGIRELLLPGAGETSPFLTAIIPVLVASLAGGFGPGVFAVALSGGLATLLYLPPVGHLAVSHPDDLTRLGGFLLEGLASAGIGGVARRSLLAQAPVAAATGRVRVLLHLERAAGLASDAPLLEPLSERELEVVRLVALGLRNDEIAATLFVSGNTVKTHLVHAYAKLSVRSRTEAVARCAALGLLDRPAEGSNGGRGQDG